MIRFFGQGAPDQGTTAGIAGVALALVGVVGWAFKWLIARDRKNTVSPVHDRLTKIEAALSGYQDRGGLLDDMLDLTRRLDVLELALPERFKETRHEVIRSLSPEMLQMDSDITRLKETRAELVVRVTALERFMERR